LKHGRILSLALAVAFLLANSSYPIFAQQQGYTPQSVSIVVLRDGSIDVQYTLQTTQPQANVPLIGFDQASSSSLKVVDGSNATISYSESGGVMTVNAPSGTIVVASYNSFKLTSKNATVWTLRINSPVSWSVTFPLDTNITAWSASPTYYYKGVPPYFVFPAGNQWVNYRLTYEEVLPNTGSRVPPALTLITAIGVAAGGSSLIVYRRYRWRLKAQRMIAKHGTMNEEEKRIIHFLAKSGGRALEADLARNLELSRTSVWRHVRNLEDQGLVVTEKLGSQNLVRMGP